VINVLRRVQTNRGQTYGTGSLTQEAVIHEAVEGLSHKLQSRLMKLGNNLRGALSGSLTTKHNDLANAPDETRTDVGPIPPLASISWEAFCKAAFTHRFYVAVIPEFYKVKSGGTNGPESSVTVSDLSFLWITLLARNGGKKDTVSESRYGLAVKYLTHTLIGHENFMTHVHGVDELEAPKAVVPPSSGSESSSEGSSDSSSDDSSDDSSSDSPSDSSDREKFPKTVPAPVRVAAPK
jgi:hypothetical protein